ncbi:hypothetical protein EST38_g546 [Candolleomyces aberdarensis]|uniref:DUF7719 domain-containing protein n=1 Tax=Candolleomyces aberdarensis TaxID=2316362 RepID=A0A4V1Q5E2_9AGAR|nr:hypothetical protein EST38_g546 [Candolleomyces aberdarensis]
MAKKTPKAASSSSGVKPSSHSDDTPRKPLIEISEEEQRRLVEQSGIMKKFKEVTEGENSALVTEYIEEKMPLPDELFNASLFIIPFSFLLLMMEILIHQQYRQNPTMNALIERMVSGVPILSIFIFYILRYKSYRVTQILLFAVSILTSSRMIYLINRGPWLQNMQQDPPLATLWILAVVMLDLGPSVLSLLTTGSFVWYKGLKLFF